MPKTQPQPKTGIHIRSRPDLRGSRGGPPRSLGATCHTMPDGSSRILPGTQIAVGHLQIPTWGDGEVSVGPVYELISGDLDWWDNLITAATAVRNDLAKLLPEADRHVRR